MSSSIHTANYESYVAIAATVGAMAVTFTQLDQITDLLCSVILSTEKLHGRRRSATLWRHQKHHTSQTSSPVKTERPENLVDILLNDNNINLKEHFRSLILGIRQDEGNGGLYLHLRLHSEINNQTASRNVRVDLESFCVELTNRFESMALSSNTFCFVADGSAGLGTQLVRDLLVDTESGVAVVDRPTWMIDLAEFVERDMIKSNDQQEKIAFALCRLQEWMVRKEVTGSSRTVAILLPDQAYVPTLLPLLYRTYPCERHVYIYDGCVSSVARACDSGIIRPTLRPLSASSFPGYHNALSKLSASHACAVEAWMSSVSSVLALKEDKEKNDDGTSYLPFMCRLEFLKSNSDNNRETRDLAVINLLQHITGSRSRPLNPDFVNKALTALDQTTHDEEQNAQKRSHLISNEVVSRIEDCVFCHKSILIGDKTLMDTVQPAVEWTLKSGKTVSGCSCCGPEEEYEDDDDEEMKKDSGNDEENSSPPGKSTYRNGTTGFAFDPNLFTGGKALRVN